MTGTENPLHMVNIVTRTKNRPIFLRRAIKSVLGQTLEDWFHIIINDGGDPKSVARVIAPYLERYDGRVKIIHNPESVGMEAASNIGLRAGQGKYAVIHDDDDTWHPDFLRRCVDHLESVKIPSVRGVITTSIRVVERIELDTLVTESSEPFNAWMNHVSLYRMSASNTFPPISFVFRRDVLDEIGYFREDLPVLGDWEFHLRFLLRYDIDKINEGLAYYHHRVGSITGDASNSVIAASGNHAYFRNRLLNQLLREELQAGRMGVGALASIASSFEVVHSQADDIRWQLGQIARGTGGQPVPAPSALPAPKAPPDPNLGFVRRLYRSILPLPLRLRLRDFRVRLIGR